MSGRKNKFSKIKSHLKSTKIDEKIGYLNKEMKKVGVISEVIANSTSDLYCTTEIIPPVPESPAEYTDVPDPEGVRSAGFVQPSNGFDVNDPATWENAYNDFSWMYNSNDVAGETDRPVLDHIDVDWTGGVAGSGIMLAHTGWGPSLGYLSNAGVYQPLVTSDLFGSMIPPIKRGTYAGGDHYKGDIPDDKWAQMQSIYAKYEAMIAAGNVPTQTIQVWYGWSYFFNGNWDNVGYPKKETGGRKILINATLFNKAGDYMSKPHENEIPGRTVVLTQHSLDDSNYYPGNPSGFMDFLRNALDVGQEAFDWLMDAAGETVNKQKDFDDEVLKNFGDKIRNLPSVKETPNKIDDAILGGLTLLNNILDPVAGAAEKFNNIVGPLAGGGGKVGLLKKSFQMAAGQLVGRTTTTFALPADDPITYNLQHAAALVSSIISGQGQEVKVSRKVQGQMLDELDPDKVKDILRIGPHTEIGSEKTIRPTEDKKGDIFNNGSAFGIIGGYEFSVDPEKGTYKIIAQKMLRTDKDNRVQTSGSNQWQEPTDAEGKIARFEDIPEIEDANLTSLVDKLINEPGIVRDFIEKGAKLGDKITGQEGTSSVYNLIKNDPTALDEVQEIVTKQINNLKPGSKASNIIQGTASNSVYIRKVLTKLGFPESQAEKEGKGYGRVYTTVQGNVSDLSPELQDLINKKRNVKESYLSEGWESPKYTYIDKNQQKRWFKEKDVAPVYPKKAPPKMMNGYHPDLLPKLGTEDIPIPQIKVKKKDLLRNHNLKKDEVKKFINLVNSLNDYIKRNPEHLAYARERYPKSDPRLAALNYKMDMQLAAADEYVEKHFPENKRLLNKVLKATKRSIKLTDPKTFKSKDGVFTTFNKLERARHFDNEYEPKERKVLKKKRSKSVSRFFYKPKKKTKYDILKDKMVVLDKEIKKTMPDM